MDFFNSAIDVLQTLVIALGGGLCVGAASTFWKATARTTPRPKCTRLIKKQRVLFGSGYRK